MKRTITQVSIVLRELRASCIGQVGMIAVIALLSISTMTACSPSDPDQVVRDHFAAGEFRESLEPLRALIKERPEDMELLFLYGRALVETGQPGLAEWPLRKAQADPEWFERASMLIASIEQAGGNAENAAETYAKMLEVNPGNMDVRIKRANVLARSPMHLQEALDEVDRILEIDPKQLSAFKPRILAYLGLNQPEEAERVLRELGERIEAEQPEDDPMRGWHCATLAILADYCGDEELARERWLGCLERYPTHPNVVGKAIDFYTSKEEPEKALAVARVAFEAETEEGSGYRLVMARLLNQLGRGDEAEAMLVEGADAADTPIRRSAALLALAEQYKQAGKLQKAADTLEKGLSITQKFAGAQPELLFALADLRVQLGQSERALELASRMTVAAHSALVRGAVAHERKEYAKAVKLYDEATRLWPDNPFAPYYGAQAALALGQIDRAFDGFLLSIRVDEESTDARIRAAQILVAEHRFPTALEMLATTRVAPSIESQMLGLYTTARMRGSKAALQYANRFSQRHADLFGQAIAVATEAVGARAAEGDDAWNVVQPFLKLGFPPHNHLPVLLAAADWAKSEEQHALVAELVAAAVEADSNSGVTRELEGILHARAGSLEAAVASFEKALELDASRASAAFRTAELLADSDPARALELLSQGLEQPLGHEWAMQERALLAATSKLLDSPGIDQVLQAGLERSPTSGRIAYQLGSVLEARGDESARVTRLVRRAVRFRAGEDAIALRDRLTAKL